MQYSETIETLWEAFKFEPQMPDHRFEGVPSPTGVEPCDLQRNAQDWRCDVVAKQKRIAAGPLPPAHTEGSLDRLVAGQAFLQITH
jgi:hypothetical protein